MRKLVAGTFLSLDGVMQAPGGPDEDREGGFPHGGWLVPYFDEKLVEVMTEWVGHAGAFLLGRKTYEIFAGSWPNATDPADEIATALNSRPKFVASRTLDRVTWNNSLLLEGEVAEEVAKLKAEEGGEIQVHGSGQLLQTLLKRKLVDTLRLWQFPSCLVAASGCLAKALPRDASSWWTPRQLRPVPCCMYTSEPVNSDTAKWRSARKR